MKTQLMSFIAVAMLCFACNPMDTDTYVEEMQKNRMENPKSTEGEGGLTFEDLENSEAGYLHEVPEGYELRDEPESAYESVWLFTPYDVEVGVFEVYTFPTDEEVELAKKKKKGFNKIWTENTDGTSGTISCPVGGTTCKVRELRDGGLLMIKNKRN